MYKKSGDSERAGKFENGRGSGWENDRGVCMRVFGGVEFDGDSSKKRMNPKVCSLFPFLKK